jgi:hypothetical protein
MSLANWIALVLAGFGAAGMWVAGKGDWRGWAIGLASQPVWAAFAIAAHTPALLLTPLIYGSVYGRNAYRWWSQSRVVSEAPVIVVVGGRPLSTLAKSEKGGDGSGDAEDR